MNRFLILLLCATFTYLHCDDKKEKEIVVPANAEEIAKVIRLKPKEIEVYLIALTESTRGDSARNEIINLLRRSDCSKLGESLISILDSKNETDRFKSYLIQHLGVTFNETQDDKLKVKIIEILKKYKDGEVEVLRGEAFMALLEAKDAEAIKFLGVCLKSGNDVVFLKLSIRYAFLLNKSEYIETIRKYLKHENKVIQLTAIYYLGQWKDKPSEEEIKAFTNSNDPQIKEAAQLALKMISGK